MTWEKALPHLIPVLKTIGILFIGYLVTKYLIRLLRKALDKANMDPSLAVFLCKIIKVLLYILVILSALNSLGVSTSGIIAAFSAAAVAISLALKDSLSNVAGGILLLLSPRFRTGDFISVGGDSGSVLKVDLLHTTLLSPDRKQISIPNGVLINDHITNFSCEPFRRVDITFPISYESDTKLAKKLALDVIYAHPLSSSEPEEPLARVMDYGDSSVNIVTRTWCRNENYWALYFDLVESIREAYEQNGIVIPFNQLDVHLIPPA